jgi:spore maturation protein CgeB
MINKKIIAIAGDWLYPQYEESFSIVLQELGYKVLPVKLSKYFIGKVGIFSSLIPLPSLSMLNINQDIKKIATSKTPYAFIFWKCTHIFPSTIEFVNGLKIKTISYNNDDPFRFRFSKNSKFYDYFHWYWYNKCLKNYNYNFFYRDVNKIEAEKYYGATHANILMPYFLPWQNKPIELNTQDKKKYNYDIVFIGHYEPDLRVSYLKALVNEGIKVKLFGSSKTWTKKVLGENLYRYFYPINIVEGEDYNKALNGAKICLSFLSKLNRDTYTRRSFEIPASGKLMLSERTEDLQKLFKEDEEACFFSNEEELLRKARFLLNNLSRLDEIAKNGRKRLIQDKHDIKNRAAQFIKRIK